MKTTFAIALFAASGFALAQSGGIGSIKIEPNPAEAGKEVKITVSAEGEAPSFCGMVVHFDDGTESRNVKIDRDVQMFPVSFGKTYAKPGTYTLRAEGKKITSHFPCVGKAEAKLVVNPGAAKAPAAAAPACPEGWTMAGKPGKGGAYACKMGKGAVAPKSALACPAGTDYFHNEKAKQLGCRAAAKK